MSNRDLTVSRAEVDDLRATLKANAEAKFSAALEQATLELTEVPLLGPFEWEVYARGPYQAPVFKPGRIIGVNQKAYIDVVVWMNESMFSTVKGFEADVLLNFWTSNTQTMLPVPRLSTQVCIEPTPAPNGGMFSTYIWEFTPAEAACLLETNICARLCNCEGRTVPGYAGFVRWVKDFDRDSAVAASPGNLRSPDSLHGLRPFGKVRLPGLA